MATKTARAARRIAYRIKRAEELVREAAAILPGAVSPETLERDTAALAELADLLLEVSAAYAPASRWPTLPPPRGERA